MAYEIKMNMTVTNDGNPFFAADFAYDNMGYKHVVAVETAYAGMLTRLNEMGFQTAMEKGDLTPEQVDQYKAILG